MLPFGGNVAIKGCIVEQISPEEIFGLIFPENFSVAKIEFRFLFWKQYVPLIIDRCRDTFLEDTVGKKPYAE